MQTTIYCKTTNNGVHSFYLLVGNEKFFLSSLVYRKGVENYYGKGVRSDESMKYSRAHNDFAITKTTDKIPMYVKYVEKEYNIEIFERTKRRCAQNNRIRCA